MSTGIAAEIMVVNPNNATPKEIQENIVAQST